MISKTEVDVSKALDLSPLDLLLCENCGRELHIPPDANNQIICPWCNAVMDKSRFLPQSRRQKLWVSEKGLKLRLERYDEPVHCNCMGHYRSVVRFRQAVIGLYERRERITLTQAIGIFISCFTDPKEGILKLSGASKDFLLDWLASMQIKRGVGRPPRSDRLLLFLDAMMLMFCPNAYGHLLHDALRLRAQEYKVEGNMTHQKRYHRFSKARRAVEVSCIRIWRELFNKDPDPPSQRWVGEGSNRKREEWWERVARQQGLIGPLAESDRFM